MIKISIIKKGKNMRISNINTKRGFTIIEVVLVLAIAGLIFLMVFIALPNMQRSQRDTQRRNDYSALSSNMTAFMTNNNGKLPSAGKLDPSKYINGTGKDPEGYVYALTVVVCTSSSTGCQATNISKTTTSSETYGTVSTTQDKSHYVYVMVNADCSGSGSNGAQAPKYNNSSRAFAIYGYLESGNGTYCQANG